MAASPEREQHEHEHEHDPAARDPIAHALEEAAELLPAQGPIAVFVHHNTLHAFQDRPFHDAIDASMELLGVQGYLPAERFRAHLASGRIGEAQLARASERYLAADDSRPSDGELLVPDSALLDTVLRHDLAPLSPSELTFAITELDGATRFRTDASARARARIAPEGTSEADALQALWAECRRLPLHRPRLRRAARGVSLPRELLMRAGAEDSNRMVTPVMVRLASAYLDEGLARRAWPERSEGFFAAWRALVRSLHGVVPQWADGLSAMVEDDAAHGRGPREVVERALVELGIPEAQYHDAIARILLALPGWAGMFRRLEMHPEDRAANAPPASLLEFLAVRVSYDLLAWRALARAHFGHDVPLATLRERLERRHADRAPMAGDHDGAWPLFVLCQYAGITRDELAASDAATRERTLSRATHLARTAVPRVFQEAYEDSYYEDVLGAVSAHTPHARTERPRAQVVCCIDDREESFRRAIEETDPRWETFGTAGFFGLAIAFQGLDDTQAAPLCPVVVEPATTIVEAPDDAEASTYEQRLYRRGLWGRVQASFLRGSRSLRIGTVLTPAIGLFAAVPFALRILFPHASTRVARRVRERVIPAPRTRLAEIETSMLSLEERTARVAATLENIGVRRFARLFVVLGHGSSSVNNPHLSAYDCGACGGKHGGPNARLFAELMNRADVREGLRARGIDIPEDTWVVGGEHDTASDRVELFDLERLPASHAADLEEARRVLDASRRGSAHERCRRFAHAPQGLSPDGALRHVETRTADLSQARPELGHVTNATCFVGRRALTRGLFLDRRAFLVSYDPEGDTDGRILERTLAAVGPVGAGISLEYYFSCVDNERLGSGTKLPHNVAALLGVMEGTESDLRTGLPRQMIEIHEPIRLLLVCETTTETLEAICARNAGVRELVVNEWIRVVARDPRTGELKRWREGRFEPQPVARRAYPRVARSVDHYRGQSDFLGPAFVEAALAGDASRRNDA